MVTIRPAAQSQPGAAAPKEEPTMSAKGAMKGGCDPFGKGAVAGCDKGMGKSGDPWAGYGSAWGGKDAWGKGGWDVDPWSIIYSLKGMLAAKGADWWSAYPGKGKDAWHGDVWSVGGADWYVDPWSGKGGKDPYGKDGGYGKDAGYSWGSAAKGAEAWFNDAGKGKGPGEAHAAQAAPAQLALTAAPQSSAVAPHAPVHHDPWAGKGGDPWIHDKGYDKGYGKGYDKGYDKGSEKGGKGGADMWGKGPDPWGGKSGPPPGVVHSSYGPERHVYAAPVSRPY